MNVFLEKLSETIFYIMLNVAISNTYKHVTLGKMAELYKRFNIQESLLSYYCLHQ